MGTKRPYSSVDGQGSGPHERRGRGEHGPVRKKLKQGRKNPGAEDASVGAMKKRARTIERRLQKQGDEKQMPANVQKDLERELVALKQRIQEAQDKKLRSTMIGKYHMVRFFERKKAQRLAKQIQKKLAEAKDPEEIAKLNKDLHIAQVDVNYTIYYPFLEQYVSLYSSSAKASKATGEKPAALLALHDSRPPMWATIEATMEEGDRALIRLQNRRPAAEQLGSAARTGKEPADATLATAGASAGEGRPKKSKARDEEARHGKGKKKGKQLPTEPVKGEPDGDESGSESDGGFFEAA